MKNKKTTTFFIISLIIVLLGYIYFFNGINVHTIISKSIKRIFENNPSISQSQKAEINGSQSMQNYYLVPTSNIYNKQRTK